MLFNGIIRSISISFLTYCFAANSLAQSALVTGDNPWGMTLAVFMHFALVAYIGVVTVFLFHNESLLDTEDLRAKFGNLYPNVKMNQ